MFLFLLSQTHAPQACAKEPILHHHPMFQHALSRASHEQYQHAVQGMSSCDDVIDKLHCNTFVQIGLRLLGLLGASTSSFLSLRHAKQLAPFERSGSTLPPVASWCQDTACRCVVDFSVESEDWNLSVVLPQVAPPVTECLHSNRPQSAILLRTVAAISTQGLPTSSAPFRSSLRDNGNVHDIVDGPCLLGPWSSPGPVFMAPCWSFPRFHPSLVRHARPQPVPLHALRYDLVEWIESLPVLSSTSRAQETSAICSTVRC